MNSRILHVLDYVYYTLVSVAVVGNTLVIISVVKFHSLRCNVNYLIGALAISDLLMTCTWPVILSKLLLLNLIPVSFVFISTSWLNLSEGLKNLMIINTEMGDCSILSTLYFGPYAD